MCSGDSYPELVTAIEDPAQGPMDTTRWDVEQIQVSRHLYLILVMLTEESALRIVQAVHDSNGAETLRLLHRRYNPLSRRGMLAKLNEVLAVDLGTDGRTYRNSVVQWEHRIHEFETMSRATLLDVVKRAIVTERSPSAIRTHLLVNAQTLTRCATVRAAIEAFPAVGWKWGPDHAGSAPTDVDAMTHKGKVKGGKSKGEGKGIKDRETGNSKSKDTEKDKVVRFGRYSGHCGKWEHRQKGLWSRCGKKKKRCGKPVNSVETDTAEPRDVDPPSEQTPVPAGGTDTLLTSGLVG